MPCFMGFLAFFMLTECVLKVSLKIHVDHILTLSNLMSFFFLSSERNLLVLAKTLGCKLSYLGILFHLLSLEIQGGLETLGYKDTVYTRGLAPLQ